jgi:hypothetical protein
MRCNSKNREKEKKCFSGRYRCQNQSYCIKNANHNKNPMRLATDMNEDNCKSFVQGI